MSQNVLLEFCVVRFVKFEGREKNFVEKNFKTSFICTDIQLNLQLIHFLYAALASCRHSCTFLIREVAIKNGLVAIQKIDLGVRRSQKYYIITIYFGKIIEK